MGLTGTAKLQFNSLAAGGANPRLTFDVQMELVFQLTRPVWGEPSLPTATDPNNGISTHSPRVGRTIILKMSTVLKQTFQLTRPVWGEPVLPTSTIS